MNEDFALQVIGYDGLKKKLNRILDIINNPEKYERLGAKIPGGILLQGAPGIGKTILAEAFCSAASGRKVYVIRKDRPDGNFVDYIRDTFQEAEENAPSIILLDDMDRFSEDGECCRKTEEFTTVQSCIDAMKGKNVFLIATVNDMEVLPEALIRSGRFDKIYTMHFPRNEDAKKIIAYYLQNKKVTDDIDVEEISRFCEGFSCADLEKVLNEAAIYGAYEGRETISQKDIIAACLRELHHTMDGDESDDVVPEDTRRRYAVHEAGHVVVAEYFCPGRVNFATINMQHGGLVCKKRDEYPTAQSIERQISISLAGKAAIELFLNETDLGSEYDLDNAFDKERRMLEDLCIKDFCSRRGGRYAAEKTMAHLDDMTAEELSRHYQTAKRILNENRGFVQAVVDGLLQEKTLSYKDIAEIRKRCAGKLSA